MDFYSGDPQNWPASGDDAPNLPGPVSRAFEDPAGYRPDEGLVDAVNVALTLGQPLLLTGEPGTGKTQLAFNVARELGLPRPIKFEVKSTTEARDLFYTFDHLRQFRDAQVPPRENAAPAAGAGGGSAARLEQLSGYLTLRGLGLAFVRAGDPSDENVARLLRLVDTEDAYRADAHSEEAVPSPPHRSVVLIDEIDKAPRDVPNDILNEIELYEFRIPELDPNFRLRALSRCRPVVIITSNSEKNLPPAFLRRCVYYDIPFPGDPELRAIVENRLPEFRGVNRLLDDVLGILGKLRQKPEGLTEPPGTAELLGWLKAILAAGLEPGGSLRDRLEVAESTLSAVVKNNADQTKAFQLLNEWLAEQG